MKVVVVAALLALCLGGCASAPTAQKIATADYGTPIAQDDAVALVTNRMKSMAKDPYSLRVDCGMVHRGWTQNKFTSRSFMAGYMIDCGINGKNSFGAYVGVRNYRFLIHNGMIVRTMQQMPNGGYGPASTVDSLRNAGIF